MKCSKKNMVRGVLFFFLFITAVNLQAQNFLLQEISDFKLKADENAQLQDYQGGKLPKSQGKQIYTFSSSFKLESLPQTDNIGFYIGPVSYAYRLYLNDRLIDAFGLAESSVDPQRYTPVFASCSPEIFHVDKNNQLRMEIFVNGDVDPLPKIGISSESLAVPYVFWRSFFGTVLVQAAVVLALILALYFLFLFFANQRRILFLYFALFCFSYGIAYCNMAFNFSANNALLLDKISRFIFPYSILFLVLFVMEYTQILHKNRIIKIIETVLAFIFSTAILFQKDMLSVHGFFSHTSLFYILPNLLFTLTISAIAVIKKEKGKYLPLLFAYLVILATSAHDISFIMQNKSPYAYLVVYGYMVIVLSMFFILAWEQSSLSRLNRERSQSLLIKNKQIRELMEKIDKVSLSIHQSSSDLEELIQNSEKTLSHYENNNKDIQKNISLGISELENSVDNASRQIETSKTQVISTLSRQSESVDTSQTKLQATIRLNKELEAKIHENAGSVEELIKLASGSHQLSAEAESTVQSIQEVSRFLNLVLVEINDISEQTNILSINAAIESARAGQQGQGFKVVSSNIRVLSQKTRETVEQSLKKIDFMNNLINQNNQFIYRFKKILDEVIQGSQNSGNRLREITQSLNDQTLAFQDMEKSISTLGESFSSLKKISEADVEEREQGMENFQQMKSSFQGISEVLLQQQQEGKTLKDLMNKVSQLIKNNSQNAAVLNEILDTRDELDLKKQI